MIIHKNVCDFCSNEEIIDEDAISFVIKFGILKTKEVISTKYFSQVEMSFCCRDCLCEWFKDNLREDGSLIEVGNEDN